MRQVGCLLSALVSMTVSYSNDANETVYGGNFDGGDDVDEGGEESRWWWCGDGDGLRVFVMLLVLTNLSV